MKTYLFAAIFGFITLIFLGCSEADDIGEIQQEYLYAEIDGEQFAVDYSNGKATCRKILTPHGTINLSFNMGKSDGKRMEFLIQNYSGSKKYIVKIPNILNGEAYENMNWMNYSEGPEAGMWSTRFNKNFNPEIPDYIEITEDNGKFLKGRFSFIGHNADGTSYLSITNGDFNVELDY